MKNCSVKEIFDEINDRSPGIAAVVGGLIIIGLIYLIGVISIALGIDVLLQINDPSPWAVGAIVISIVITIIAGCIVCGAFFVRVAQTGRRELRGFVTAPRACANRNALETALVEWVDTNLENVRGEIGLCDYGFGIEKEDGRVTTIYNMFLIDTQDTLDWNLSSEQLCELYRIAYDDIDFAIIDVDKTTFKIVETSLCILLVVK